MFLASEQLSSSNDSWTQVSSTFWFAFSLESSAFHQQKEKEINAPPAFLNLLRYVAAAKLLQSCLTLCDPIDGSPQAPTSLGFSRQEYWSGVPFSSPMHESEKSRWSHSVVSDSSWPHGLQPTRLLCPWDFPGKSTGVGCHCLLLIIWIIICLLNWIAKNNLSFP